MDPQQVILHDQYVQLRIQLVQVRDELSVARARLLKSHATALFDQLDGNGNGVLDMDEVQYGLCDLGFEDSAIEGAFMQMDFNNDGFVDREVPMLDGVLSFADADAVVWLPLLYPSCYCPLLGVCVNLCCNVC